MPDPPVAHAASAALPRAAPTQASVRRITGRRLGPAGTATPSSGGAAGPRPPRNVGADDRGPCAPDLELEQPIAELRDGGGEQIGDGARRSGPHKLVSYPVAARAASRQWLPTSKSFILASSMAKPRRGDSLALTIDDLAFGGEGVGRVDGYVVFVRGGVPGDRLRVKLYEARSRFGRAAIEAVEAPSPDRVEAPCPYFGRCGGCRLQHVAYPAQLAFKTKQVRDCLERLGGLGAFELRPILAAPEPYGYRNKMEFTVAEEAGVPVLGLHQADRYDVVLDIERCLLQSDAMNRLLDGLRREVRARALSVYDQGRGQGLLRFVSLREGRRTGETMVNIVASTPDVERLGPVAERLRECLPGTASVVLNVTAKKASVAVGTEEHLVGGRDHLRE